MNEPLGIIKTALITATTTAAASVIANVTWQDNYGNIDWRDLAIISCIGTVLGARFAKSEKMSTNFFR